MEKKSIFNSYLNYTHIHKFFSFPKTLWIILNERKDLPFNSRPRSTLCFQLSFMLFIIDLIASCLCLFVGYFVNYTNYVIEVKKRVKLMLESKSEKKKQKVFVSHFQLRRRKKKCGSRNQIPSLNTVTYRF